MPDNISSFYNLDINANRKMPLVEQAPVQGLTTSKSETWKVVNA